jgi:hypothetical protein
MSADLQEVKRNILLGNTKFIDSLKDEIKALGTGFDTKI